MKLRNVFFPSVYGTVAMGVLTAVLKATGYDTASYFAYALCVGLALIVLIVVAIR